MNPSKRQIVIWLGLAATSINAGCAASNEAPSLDDRRTDVAQASCIERAAATQPPRHPLLELTKCIIETDDMSDPDRLYSQVLHITGYSKIPQKWGYQLFSSAEKSNFDSLPIGLHFVNYTINNQEEKYNPGRRYLHMSLKANSTCVKFEQAIKTFGNQFEFVLDRAIPAPAIPSPPPQISAPAPWTRQTNIFGIKFKNRSKADSTLVSIIFSYQTCAPEINIFRNPIKENQ
ncbi:MAG: hypothetical protein JSS56_05070 [Proteobacteria bacterium]|nr:hypothetical protein [Pseudomonadota bacterium]